MKILKTVKLYIGGQFPRSESGRVYPVMVHGTDKIYANICQSSRKDLRAAVEAAQNGCQSWFKLSAYNRGQILYRMAEMMEGKRPEFAALFSETLGYSSEKSNEAIDFAIDALVYYAGFTDKVSQVTASVNPVSGPHHNFSTPEPVGVTALIASDQFDFGKLLDQIASVLVGGNSLVVLLGKECPAVLAPLAEVFATSDLPAGVVNLLTGHLDELAEVIGSHMEIRSISYQNENETLYYKMKAQGVENMKRFVSGNTPLSLKSITDFVEYKTVWHPVGS